MLVPREVVITAYTLKIRAFPAGATDKVLESAWLAAEVVQDLAYWARECGAYPLRSWAKANAAPLYYVDNCAVRARVSGVQIRQFAAQVLKDAEIGPQVEDTSTYLIEATEF
jgi:hypothetical protein